MKPDVLAGLIGLVFVLVLVGGCALFVSAVSGDVGGGYPPPGSYRLED